MANVAPPGLSQFFDNNGNPAAGHLLYTYDTGTTTPRSTWANAAETTLNANPVVLDASGRAQIFYRGNYRLELRTPANAVIWTQDGFNVPDPNAGTSIEFANGTAATPSVRFTQAPNGGLFSPAAGVVAVSQGGIERMRFTGGQVAIGGTSALALLDVWGTLRARGAFTVTTGGITVDAGGMTVTAGGLTVSAGGANVTGNSTVTGNLTVAGGTFTSRGFADNATTAAWNIDSTGRLRNSSNTQISFSARRTTSPSSGTFVFPDVTFPGGHNRGGMYDTVTGNATVPTGQGGDYLVFFNAHCIINASGATITIELRVNGSPVLARGFGGNDVGGSSGIGINTVLSLAAGDVVSLAITALTNAAIQPNANFAMRQVG